MASPGSSRACISAEGGHDLLVLDAMLPGIDGFSLLAAFRKTKQTPVLMLTARVSVEDRVLGLQTGADDYLVKPFAFSELSARIQVLLRRTYGARDTVEPTQLRLADLEVDLMRRKASRGGQRLDLTAKEFLLLGDRMGAERAYQMGMVNRVVPRVELEDQVYAMAQRLAAQPRLGLALTKMVVNKAEELQGLRSTMDMAFGYHHFAHAHSQAMGMGQLGGQDARSMAKANKEESKA